MPVSDGPAREGPARPGHIKRIGVSDRDCSGIRRSCQNRLPAPGKAVRETVHQCRSRSGSDCILQVFRSYIVLLSVRSAVRPQSEYIGDMVFHCTQLCTVKDFAGNVLISFKIISHERKSEGCIITMEVLHEVYKHQDNNTS